MQDHRPDLSFMTGKVENVDRDNAVAFHASLVADYGDQVGYAMFVLWQHIMGMRLRGNLDNIGIYANGVEVSSHRSIRSLQGEIAEWADTLIPDRTPEQALRKLMEHEIPELVAGGSTDPLEFADVCILLFDIAHLRGIDIGSAIRDKMAINRDREWAIDTGTGLMSHIKKGQAS